MESLNLSTRRERFCLITYFRRRALKQLLQWLLVATISILVLGSFAVADAYAAGIVGCADLAGISNPVSPNNSGSFDFGDPTTTNYRAELCSPGTFTKGNPDDFYLDGWVWDANLGWISLYCPGGSGAKNRGLSCGSIPYGVKVDLSDGGKMYGWAWGDNVGWISFGCKSGSNNGYSCGSVTYNGVVNVDISSSNFGKLSGYVWADSVGWFSLNNVSAKILGLVMAESDSESDWGVWTKAENGLIPEGDMRRDDPPIKKSASPIGDGTPAYELFVHVADINGNPPGSDISVDITTKWTDTVHWDQTTDTEPANYNSNNNGPVKKPLTLTSTSSKSTTGGVSGNYYGEVISYAPTDMMNCFDATHDLDCNDAEDYLYKNFDDAAPSNNLQYGGADVTITKISTGETVSLSLPPMGNSIMEFVPTVDITAFNFLKPNESGGFDSVNYIESFRNVADSFLLKGRTRGSAPAHSVALKLTTAASDVLYGWIDDLEDLPETEKDSVRTFSNVDSIPKNMLAMPYAPDSTLSSQIEGAKAYAEVTYKAGGGTVKYFCNGVPRREDSYIINQAAEILSGQVYSPGATQVTDIVITSIGDIATNRVRNQILENVSRMKAGAQVTDHEGGKAELNEYAKFSLLGGDKAFYYSNADLYIDKAGLEYAAGVANKEPFSIIVEGGDIFITENVDLKGIPVGFIALADLNETDEAARGGRMYVDADVTDMVDVHIYLDGPMFRYTDSVCFFTGEYDVGGIFGLREPNFVTAGRCDGATTGYANPLSTLVNQFYFKGTVASQNCIGCAALTDLYRGDGQLIGSPTPLLYAIARLYDFNYFGYFRVDIDGVDSGARSTYLDPSQSGPVYFEYSAQPELPGFSS